MLFRCLIAAAVLLAGFSYGAGARARAYHSNPSAWVIGPIIKGRNYSQAMPLHPSPGPRGSMQFLIPQAPGSAHYVTFRHGSLAGKKRIVMRYRIEADPGVRIVPRTMPGSPSIITLYFQRAGDNWSGKRRFETYRWYATFASHSPITPGNHEMIAPLDGNWTAIQTSSARTSPPAFQAAIAQADQVGFVLGGGDGFGHGIFATGRARLIVSEFRVE